MRSPDRSRALKTFIFDSPDGFFDGFDALEQAASPLTPALLAFRENLVSAFAVGSIPFHLARSATTQEYFQRIFIAECIRNSSSEKLTKEEKDKSYEIAQSRMREACARREVIKELGDRSVQMLAINLDYEEFRSSSEELLRQLVVMSWGAFEALVSDTVRILFNCAPHLVGRIVENKIYKDALIGRNVLVDALMGNGFDLSTCMGEIFADNIKLDSIERIRDVIDRIFPGTETSILVHKNPLWLLAQQRNLIVHKRGIVDAYYLSRTGDMANAGSRLKLDAQVVEEGMLLVRDTGLSLLRTASEEFARAVELGPKQTTEE